MKIGYVRVSTIEQNEQRQLEALKGKGIEKYFVEKVSGKDMNRPQLNSMLEFAREGDVIFIHDLSRLARNTADLLAIIEKLEEKGIRLVSNKEDIDTTTATGRLMITMLAAIYDFERSILKERQMEGISIARASGKYSGRQRIPKPANWDEVISKYNCRQLSAKKSMELLNLKPNVFYNFLKEEGNKVIANNDFSFVNEK
ncbi:MAG: recombinase family protein [Desulfitobacteriaceae bacterium]|nr:recombinase family protein [Desulfitobacteriaceae bacterium]